MADYASEGGHWYKKDGTPCYTVIGKNGKERPTTLRDARKLGLLPSVTSIIGLASRPGLDAWKQEQTILACLTMPLKEGESEADYIARLKADAKAQAEKAAGRGTLIHAYIELGFLGDCPIEGTDYYLSALEEIITDCGNVEWVTGESFATPDDEGYPPYGGKDDLHNRAYLIDIKTTEKDVSDLKTWDEHAMQLAAYDNGLGNRGRKCGILYINYKADTKLIWLEPKELQKGWNCFMALLDYWYAKTELKKGL